jgi:hypothetical protein
LIVSYLEAVQALHDNLAEVHRSRFKDEATGVSLDGIGQIVGAFRRGLEDEQFLSAINAKIVSNSSAGTVAELQAAFVAALDNTYTLEIRTSEHSAEFAAHLEPAVDLEMVDYLRALLQASKAAGVKAILRTNYSNTNTFRFAGGSGAARGFGVGVFSGAG